ncbi:hypothetical protein GCM10020367_63240 [Streptomyces sannanensis]|uniref:Uncharacterized protein n=1 Tax=Streptomyces sannanensis TaxID=285536 RepID=A0ABP6SKV4_9ACTN
MFENLMGRIACRFARAEPGQRARSLVLGHRRLHGGTGHFPPVKYENNRYLAATKPQVTICPGPLGGTPVMASLPEHRPSAPVVCTQLWQTARAREAARAA